MTPKVIGRVAFAKEAGVGSLLARYARPAVMRAGALPGAAVGAGVGAAGGVAQQAVSGEGDYLGGALRGGAIGALGGAAGGHGIAKARDISLTTGKRGLALAKETAGRVGKSVGDFGKRQVHGVTGWTPKKGPQSIGLAGGSQAEQAKKVKALRDARMKGAKTPKARDKIKKDSDKKLEGLSKQELAAKDMHDAGMTSVPGMVKGLKDPKRMGKAVARNVKAQGVTGMVALPAAFAASNIAAGGDTPTTIGGAAGDVLGAATATRLPILPQMVAWDAMSRAGGAIGKAISGDKKRKLPKVSPPPPSAAQPVVGEQQ